MLTLSKRTLSPYCKVMPLVEIMVSAFLLLDGGKEHYNIDFYRGGRDTGGNFTLPVHNLLS